MVKLMDLLQDHLRQHGVTHLRLDGHTKGDERGELLHQFNTDDKYAVFLLSTRAGGQGLNLQSADTVIIFDSDWNPQMDLQAMARAHRIGQKMEVRVLRLITASPIEEKILATANEKLDKEAKIIEAGKFNQTSDASERRETLQKILAQSAEDAADESCIPTDEDINEMLARPNEVLGLTREQEVARLNEMDAQRIKEEVARGRAAGLKGAQQRLLTEEELPAWLGEAELMQQQQREADTGVVDGPRERKATSYGGDELSERDFTRFMQSGLELDQWRRLEEVRKKKLEEKAAAAASASGSDGGSKPPPAKKAKQTK